MALYPDTSCFYRAEVIATPKEMQGGGRVRMGVLVTKAMLTI
jgi:SAGA-associated factor 29